MPSFKTAHVSSGFKERSLQTLHRVLEEQTLDVPSGLNRLNPLSPRVWNVGGKHLQETEDKTNSAQRGKQPRSKFRG